MNNIKTFFLAFALVIAAALPGDALAKKKAVVDIYELTLDENIETPVPENEKIAANIEEFQYEVAVKLKKHNLDVEMMRHNQVIVVTFPASKLFAPNDTLLTEEGKLSLKPLLPFIKNAGLYKALLVMHSDNTGSREYTLSLTTRRVNSVFDWVEINAPVDFVVPYALGETDPAVDNNSVDNRNRNRRLEIFLVPEQNLLNAAAKGKISMNIIKDFN